MTFRVRTEQPVYGGYTLYKEEGKEIIFIKGALPGELVDIVIVERKKDYSIARVVEIIEPSEWRVKPACDVYGICGGCQLQHADYNYQLTIKSEVLRDVLKRIAKLDIQFIPVRSLRPFNYRYRAQFKTGPSGIGFYKDGTKELIPITSCPLMIEEINAFIPVLSGLSHLRALKEIHVSSNKKECLLYLKGLHYNKDIMSIISSNGTWGIIFENRACGLEFINLSLDIFSYTVSARSFFQSNWELNKELINRISEVINNKEARVLDLYAGAGNFSIPLSSTVKEVIAVEENPYAFSDLKRNLEINSIKNCKPVHSSIEKFRATGHYDIIIIDPPRPGMTDRALRTVLESGAKQILYISCNPTTLARDIRKLSGTYELHSIEIFDFFPNTYHIETLAVLHRRD